MTFLTLPPQDRSPQWIAQLTAVWEASVRATHHFLDEAAIQAIAPEVPQALPPFARNLPSCRVLEKAGFQLEGTLRQNAVKDGEVLDMKLYARLRDGRP